MADKLHSPDWLTRINAAIDDNKISDSLTIELLLAALAWLPPDDKRRIADYMERECKAAA